MTYSRAEKVRAALQYSITSIGIMIVLKQTLTVYAFPSALVVAFCQSVVQFVLLVVLKQLKVIHYPQPSRTNLMSVMPLPILQAIGIGAGLAGTKALSIPMFTLLRRISVALTLFGEIYILQKRQHRYTMWAVGIICAGTVVAALNDFAFDVGSYAIIMAANIATSANGIIVAKMLSGPNKREKWELLWYNSIVSLVLLGYICHSRGHFVEALEFMRHASLTIFVCFTISCSLGFFMQFAVVSNHQINGPLSTAILGCVKNVLTTYAGVLGLGGDYIFTWPNFAGVNISLLGSLMYAYAKMKQKKIVKKEIEVGKTDKFDRVP